MQTTVTYLKAQGITHIDHIFLSHQDTDHIGYLKAITDNFMVDEIVTAGGFDDKVQRLLDNNEIKIVHVSKGQKVNLDGHTALSVVAPQSSIAGTNEESMVLFGKFGRLSWLFTGDLPREGETEIIGKYDLKVDVLKVGHHGSKTSTDPDFLREIHPQIALVSAGRDNRYGHPNDETILNLKNENAKIYNTQTDGMVEYIYYTGGEKFVKFFE